MSKKLTIEISNYETVQNVLAALHEANTRLIIRAAKGKLNFFEEDFKRQFSEQSDNCGGQLFMKLENDPD